MKIARKTKEKENYRRNFLLKSPIRKELQEKTKIFKIPIDK